MKLSSPPTRVSRISASWPSNSSRELVWMPTRLEAERKVRSPPNRPPAIAAINSRFDEAKKEAELSTWPSSWPSRKRLSRAAMLRIQAVRITVMSVLITPPRWCAEAAQQRVIAQPAEQEAAEGGDVERAHRQASRISAALVSGSRAQITAAMAIATAT